MRAIACISSLFALTSWSVLGLLVPLSAQSHPLESWNLINPQMPSETFRHVHHANGTWVVISEGGLMMTSLDAWHWNPISSSEEMAGINAIQEGGGTWVMVGQSGKILTSDNTLEWTARDSATSENLRDVSYENGLWVVIGGRGTILTSSDAIHWNSTQLDDNESFLGVAYGNGRWIVGDPPTPSTPPKTHIHGHNTRLISKDVCRMSHTMETRGWRLEGMGGSLDQKMAYSGFAAHGRVVVLVSDKSFGVMGFGWLPHSAGQGIFSCLPQTDLSGPDMTVCLVFMSPPWPLATGHGWQWEVAE